MIEKAEAVATVSSKTAQSGGRHALTFLRAFIKSPGKVGAIVPSAPELARAMMKGLDIGVGESILELGPGTGAFTLEIQNILHDSSSYLGIEREAGFVELLQYKFPEMRIVNASAEDAWMIHRDAGLGPVKVIISSLPFASIVASVRIKIINDIQQLMSPGCVFRTFQYVHAFPLPSAIKFRREMEMRFGPCERSAAVLPNVPPAYVLTWRV
jgi:phospholipid N-methyltransferase